MISLSSSASPTMAAVAPPSSSSFSKPSPFFSSAKSHHPISRFNLPFSPLPQKPSPLRHLRISSSLSPKTDTTIITTTTNPLDLEAPISRFAPDEPRKGADVLVEALERQGVTDVFAYPGGASMEIHQALTRSSSIRNVLPRHEQGGVFAAEGYARASGRPGVCIATSGPGATNLVSGLADALMDSIPVVAITGQVPRRMIGTDAFQETPIVEVTRSITKHNYLVLDVEDIPRVVREAFFLATSGRPGPVLIDIPKDVQQQLVVPNWDQPIKLPGYMSRLPKSPNEGHLEQIVRLVSESKKPVLYVGGGCLNSSEELRRFVELTGIPVASTLMGLGAYPCNDEELSLQMLGMHGTVYANYAVDKSDLLLAFGVRFDDRVTGKLEAFASRAKIVHIDIDSAEIGKNKQPHVSVCADVKSALEGLNRILEQKESKVKLDFSAWRAELKEEKVKFPLGFKTFGDSISPQNAIQVLDELTDGLRDHPDRKEQPASVLQINPQRQSIRVRADFGYRDFTLDGVSLSEEDDLGTFYRKFVQSRIDSVKLGEKCTIMMYGPTGSGKSHTMFGCCKQPGIVYRSLKDILGDGEDDGGTAVGSFVQVTVLEIYNEEIYDLLSSNGGGGFGFGWPKSNGSNSKVRLEVMGKKAKNATYISGNEAGKISKEIQKVEKRRIVRSTLCNDRSSRSHCMIILDVPTVGGRLMLVDMAGSENIEQAGQIGFEAKMQTAKINQGNIALKRVVESIANGDSHVPFRDSKLTMLLQDSFEDDKTKILMVLCASPDPKEIHKTISTLEYGAKAKCIVRGPHTPIKDKTGTEDASAVILGSRIAAMDEFILKLQRENKLKEKERNAAHKELMKKEEEVAALRSKLELTEGKRSGAKEEEINLKVNEVAQTLKYELEKKLAECQRMANEFVELERRRMEERILQQQQEVEMLRKRLEEIELELCRSSDGNGKESRSKEPDGTQFAKRLLGIYASDDAGGMVKSMDLDMDDQEPFAREIKYVGVVPGVASQSDSSIVNAAHIDSFEPKYADRVCLSTVFEEEEMEEEEGANENVEAEEVEKEVIEEKRVCVVDGSSFRSNYNVGYLTSSPQEYQDTPTVHWQSRNPEEEHSNGKPDDRLVRIRNIFTLCGNYRELSQHIPSQAPTVASVKSENEQKLVEPEINKSRVCDERALASKENCDPSNEGTDSDTTEVYVKWEGSKENPGKFITTLKVVKDATLADLRKLIEIYLGADNQAFTFLMLDPSGASVAKEKESATQATKLPLCDNQSNGYLACLRPLKGMQSPSQLLPLSPLPLNSLENQLPLTPTSCFSVQGGDCTTPKVAPNLGSTPYITVRKHK